MAFAEYDNNNNNNNNNLLQFIVYSLDKNTLDVTLKSERIKRKILKIQVKKNKQIDKNSEISFKTFVQVNEVKNSII